MMLFPKFLFLATTFLKIDKNSILLVNFYQKFQNDHKSHNKSTNARKSNDGFLNFFENRLN